MPQKIFFSHTDEKELIFQINNELYKSIIGKNKGKDRSLKQLKWTRKQ